MEDVQFVIDLVGLAEALWAIGGAVIGVLGTLIFGPRYKQRIGALEAEIAAMKARPVINQTFNYNAAAPDPELELRNAARDSTVQGLQETIGSLPQHPLEGGHTYAELPEGTRVVTMADGSIRLALPVRLSATLRIGSVTATGKVSET